MNKRKTIISGVVKAVIFSGILAALLAGAQEMLTLDTGHRGSDVVNGFYAEKKNDIDVVFLGSSTMFCTVDPLVLYEEYGIASYDFGCSAQAFESEYLYLQEVLKYQKPRVIGLEVVGIKKETDPSNLEVWSYAMTDLRFSREKVTELWRMLKTDKQVLAAQLFPLFQYKDRWKEVSLKEQSGGRRANYTKGAYTPDKITEEPLDFSRYFDDEEAVIPEENRKTLERIVKTCREENIELFLFKGPNIGWTENDTKLVQELADQYQLPFLNYFDLLEELQVDPVSDFRDFSHFNRSGSRKASIYLGNYLKERYDLPDRRTSGSSNSWDISLLDRAHDRANERLAKTRDLPTYLPQLSYKGQTVVFHFAGETQGLQQMKEVICASLGLEEERVEGSCSFVIENGVCISGILTEGQPVFEKRLGRGFLGKHKLSVSSGEIRYDGRDYKMVENGLTIFVYDNEWECVADVVGFDVTNPAEGVRPAEDGR